MSLRSLLFGAANVEPPRCGAQPSGLPHGRRSLPPPGCASRPGRGSSFSVSSMNGLRRPRLPGT
eukprot:7164442-Alexandrium_andersonii.AAC.1